MLRSTLFQDMRKYVKVLAKSLYYHSISTAAIAGPPQIDFPAVCHNAGTISGTVQISMDLMVSFPYSLLCTLLAIA